MSNAPDRYEAIVLEDGERPVEVADDTKIPNAATFTIIKQDHTVGNMLRAQLLDMPQILFAGYKVPHPLHPKFQIKVQTDGSITPQEVMEQACHKLIGTITSLEDKFKREFSFKKADGETGGTGVGEGDAYGGTGAAGSNAWATGSKDYWDL